MRGATVSDLRQEAIATAPAAGWYPDPANASASRWWDGSGWTDHVQPAAVAAVPTLAVVQAPVVQVPVVQPPVVQAPVSYAPAVPQPSATVTTVPQPSTNIDADGVPLTLFADSVFSPSALAPVSGPTTQEDWHNQTGRGSKVRRQVAGSVSLSTAGSTSKRISDPYERNWIAGLALVVAVLSIPTLALRIAWDFPLLTQTVLGGAPIALSLLALATAIRRGGRIAISLISVVVSGLVLVAGLVVDPVIFHSAIEWVTALLPA
jgi:hypothetical protein